MPVKLVVFDIAGTTLKDDSNVTAILKKVLARFGHDFPAETIDPLMGYEKSYAIAQLLEQSKNVTKPVSEQLVTAIHKAFIADIISFYEQEELTSLPNVEETFYQLKQSGIKVGINTGFSRGIADVIIRKLGWEKNNLIDKLVASDEVTKGRPYPHMIKMIMESTGVDNPLEVAKVGDTEVDIHEGQNAGCRFVIGVTTGTFTRNELETYHPTHIVDDIADILPIVSN
jgi:phosphonatase-like hydrolase